MHLLKFDNFTGKHGAARHEDSMHSPYLTPFLQLILHFFSNFLCSGLSSVTKKKKLRELVKIRGDTGREGETENLDVVLHGSDIC